MQFFSDLTSGGGITFDAFLKFSDLDRRVQKHVQKVYALLAVSLLVVALGVCVESFVHLGGAVTSLIGLGCIFGLQATPSISETLNTRYALFGAFAFLEGLSIGPLVLSVMAIYPSVVMTAFFMTLVIFASFSGAALVAKRRSMLYLTSVCSIGLTSLLVMSFASLIFGASSWTFLPELYLGLIVFSLYVLVDTQILVERASAGDDDAVKAAMQLLLDFVNIFIRILIILADKKQKEERRGERRRKSR